MNRVRQRREDEPKITDTDGTEGVRVLVAVTWSITRRGQCERLNSALTRIVTVLECGVAIFEKSRLREQGLAGLWKSNLGFAEKFVRSPLRLIPPATRVSVRSGVNKGRRWIVGASNHSCWLGNYEHEKQELVNRSLKPGMCVWDVGANVGFYTLAFSTRVGSEGEVVAFEPLAANVSFLWEHILDNKLKNVVVVQAAVSRSSGLISFSVGAGNSMGKIESSRSSYQLPAVTLDEYATRARKPNLIKIDVEGAEASVLEGGAILLREHKPELWIALHGEEAKKDVVHCLKGLGYRTFGLDGSRLEYPFSTDEIVAR